MINLTGGPFPGPRRVPEGAPRIEIVHPETGRIHVYLATGRRGVMRWSHDEPAPILPAELVKRLANAAFYSQIERKKAERRGRVVA